MSDFKVGDPVRVVARGDLHSGSEGRVSSLHPNSTMPIMVAFNGVRMLSYGKAELELINIPARIPPTEATQ